MPTLQNRIIKGILAILKAKEEGRDTTEWQNHLFELVSYTSDRRVKVKLGRFGFCTCKLSQGLCAGCWRIVKKCKCEEIFVTPEEEATKKYAELMARLDKTQT